MCSYLSTSNVTFLYKCRKIFFLKYGYMLLKSPFFPLFKGETWNGMGIIVQRDCRVVRLRRTPRSGEAARRLYGYFARRKPSQYDNEAHRNGHPMRLLHVTNCDVIHP